jgi:tight adherence protein B
VGVVLIVGGSALLARRVTAHRRERCAAERTRRAVARFAAEVAAEVRVGLPARPAVARVAAAMSVGGWAAAASTAATGGGDVAAVLRGAAGLPGASDLRDLAACWQVAESSGVGLAAGFEAVVGAAAERELFRSRLRAELAGVRASGWVLASLPLLGLLMGTALGARPVAVLLGTPAGVALLAVGSALEALGLFWLHRMTAGVEAVIR